MKSKQFNSLFFSLNKLSFAQFFILSFFISSLYAEEDKNKSAETGNMIVSEAEFEKGVMEREMLRYSQLINDYKKEIQSLLKRNIEEKKRLVEMKYAPAIKKEAEQEESSRNDAIVLFENFIKKYPDSKKYTPNALYRLAELYFDRSSVIYSRAMDKYEEEVELYESGKLEKEPIPPQLNYENTINLYKRIISQFPDFKYIDGAYYMLGFCLDVSGNQKEAVDVWKEMISKNIKSKYTAEIYYRIGEFYFNTNKLPEAIEYFTKASEFKDSDFYDKIMYKLAWTYYRQNEYQKSVELFTKLIIFADENKEKGIDKGQDLRKEAVQYIAISFADEEWGNIDKAIAYFNSINGRNFEVDVFEKLGNYYLENSNYDFAEKAFRFIIDRHPLYHNLPKIHYELINAFNRARNFDKAFQELEIFSKKYSSESDWAKENRANVTALRFAEEQAKNALIQSAAYHHRQAQSLKTKNDLENAKKEYKIASQLYLEYVNKFPYTSDSYDISWSLAETLYNAGDIELAVVVFERIRDDKNQDKYKKDAASATFICYNTLWEKSEAEKNQSQPEDLRGKPLTKIEQKLIESSDIYFSITKDDPNRAVYAYNVARIFYDHGQFQEAERRYLEIINEFPTAEVAFNAARDIIYAYNEKKDWVNVAKWSKLLTERLSSSGAQSTRKELAEFKTYRVGALFKYAETLMEEGKYKESAEEFLRVVLENPYTENADVALYNAAVCYSKALLFDSALQLHERVFKEYPYSKLAPTSLFLVADNAERSYDYQKAIQTYELLYYKYPDNPRKSDAIYNAALLKERLKMYKEASKNYYLYYKDNAQKFEGKEALYFAAYMYQKAEDWNGMISKYNDFINAFKNDAEVYYLVMASYYEIAKVYEEKLNNWQKAKEYYKKILEYFESKKDVDERAVAIAAEARFKLIEDDFAAFEKIKIKDKDPKKLEASFAQIKASLKTLNEQYDEVVKFKIAEWTFASFFRKGLLLQIFANILYNAPTPDGLTDEELDIYEQMIQDQVAPLEEAAVDMYVKTLEKAREQKVFNKWTQLIIEKLSALRPDEYKMGKPLVFAEDLSLETSLPIFKSLDKDEEKKYVTMGLDRFDKKEVKENSETKEKEAKETEDVKK